jgi:hypothetical protein
MQTISLADGDQLADRRKLIVVTVRGKPGFGLPNQVRRGRAFPNLSPNQFYFYLMTQLWVSNSV